MNRDKEHCADYRNECQVIRFIEDVLQVKLLQYQKLLVIHVFETNECKLINLCSDCRTKMEKKMDDTISRQQAINALWAERMKHDEEMERNLETCSFALRADNKARRNRVEEDIEIIRQLPPAEPDIIYCKDCVKHNKRVGDYVEKSDGTYDWIWKPDACPLAEFRGKAQGHEFDYQFCAYAERREDGQAH